MENWCLFHLGADYKTTKKAKKERKKEEKIQPEQQKWLDGRIKYKWRKKKTIMATSPPFMGKCDSIRWFGSSLLPPPPPPTPSPFSPRVFVCHSIRMCSLRVMVSGALSIVVHQWPKWPPGSVDWWRSVSARGTGSVDPAVGARTPGASALHRCRCRIGPRWWPDNGPFAWEKIRRWNERWSILEIKMKLRLGGVDGVDTPATKMM